LTLYKELTDESKSSQEFERVVAYSTVTKREMTMSKEVVLRTWEGSLLIGLLHCNRETNDIEQRTD